jgi:hypothetical protein
MSLSLPRSRRDLLLAVVVSGLFLAAIFAVGYDLLVRSPLSWHIRQPASVQGGVEALLLMGVWMLAAWLGRRWSYALALVAGLLYLRRHNAELNLLVGLVYLEILLGLGRWLLVRLGGSGQQDDLVRLLVAGVSLWALLCLLLSLMHLALPWLLGVTLLALGVVVLATQYRHLTSVRLWQHLKQSSACERALAGCVLVWFLVLAARAHNVQPYDALWYISQGDRLLVSNGSLFESLALVSPVHYFPKLWELLLLPLTVFEDLRLQMSLGIASLALLGGLLWQLAERVGLAPLWRWGLVWVLVSLPAIANSALGLKADLLSGCFLVAMCSQLWLWAERGSWCALAYAVAAAALACSAKLIAIPYVGIALLLTLGLACWYRFKPRPATLSSPTEEATPLEKGSLVALCLALLVAVLLLARTWILAGVPTIGPAPLMSVWNVLGWELQEPIGTLNWTRPQNWAEVPRLVYEWLLAPSYMKKIVISWTGNFWMLLLLVALGLAIVREPAAAAPQGSKLLLVLMALTGLWLAVFWSYHSRGSDGNYFLFAVCMAGLVGLNAVVRRLERLPKLAFCLSLALLLTGLFHATQSFITTSWSPPGTRAWDTNLSRVSLPGKSWREAKIEQMGLASIAAYLRAQPGERRVIAHGYEPLVVNLPARVELLEAIVYSRPQYTSDLAALFAYMEKFSIDYLLLAPPNAKSPNRRLQELYKAMETHGWPVEVDRGGMLFSRPQTKADLH